MQQWEYYVKLEGTKQRCQNSCDTLISCKIKLSLEMYYAHTKSAAIDILERKVIF
jgi:hypothetical protein